MPPASNSVNALPAPVELALADLVQSAQESFGDTLRAIVLFGTAAEGQMRATSDVNLVVVLTRFDRAQVDAFSQPLQMAHATIRASVMFLLEGELHAAADAFAVKFADIGRRRRLLFGEDVLAGVAPSRAAVKRRAVQTVLNLQLRLRERYAAIRDREAALALLVAESASALRAAAAALLELEGHPVASPKAALATVVRGWAGEDWTPVLQHVSTAREKRFLPPGVAADTLFRLMEVAERLRARLEGMA